MVVVSVTLIVTVARVSLPVAAGLLTVTVDVAVKVEKDVDVEVEVEVEVEAKVSGMLAVLEVRPSSCALDKVGAGADMEIETEIEAGCVPEELES